MPVVLEKPDPKLKGTMPEIAAARISFLFGNGGGVPVQNTKELARLHNLSEKTIRKYVPTWLKESEEKAAKVNNEVLGLSLSNGPLSVPPETLVASNKDTDFLRKRLDDLKNEIENIDKTVNWLEKILNSFDNDEKEFLSTAFQFYLRTSANKQSLTKQYLAVHTRWTAVAGVDSIREIQVAGAKAVSVAQAKAGSNDTEEKDSEELAVGFKRRS